MTKLSSTKSPIAHDLSPAGNGASGVAADVHSMLSHERTQYDSANDGGSDLVVVAAADGTIHSVLSLPTSNGGSYPAEMSGNSVDAIWSAEIAAQIKDNIRSSLRSRQLRSARIRDTRQLRLAA